MSEFYVGQKVVCVDDSVGQFGTDTPIKANAIYTVRWIGLHHYSFIVGSVPSIRVSGVKRRSNSGGTDLPFGERRFRAVEYKSMSIFRAIAADPTRKLEDA